MNPWVAVTIAQVTLSLVALGLASRLVYVASSDREAAGDDVPAAEAEVWRERIRSAQALWLVAAVATAINGVQWFGTGLVGAVAYAALGLTGRALLVIWAWKRLQSWQTLRRLVR